MSPLVRLAAFATELYERWRTRPGRCQHTLIQMPGGAACIRCPRVWAWHRTLPDDDE